MPRGAARLRVGEHDPGRGHVDQVDAALGQRLEEIDDVVLVDERVGQRYQCLD
jgi:hypothetical protein